MLVSLVQGWLAEPDEYLFDIYVNICPTVFIHEDWDMSNAFLQEHIVHEIMFLFHKWKAATQVVLCF